jgi:hypothetical protein
MDRMEMDALNSGWAVGVATPVRLHLNEDIEAAVALHKAAQPRGLWRRALWRVVAAAATSFTPDRPTDWKHAARTARYGKPATQ